MRLSNTFQARRDGSYCKSTNMRGLSILTSSSCAQPVCDVVLQKLCRSYQLYINNVCREHKSPYHNISYFNQRVYRTLPTKIDYSTEFSRPPLKVITTNLSSGARISHCANYPASRLLLPRFVGSTSFAKSHYLLSDSQATALPTLYANNAEETGVQIKKGGGMTITTCSAGKASALARY